MANKADVGAVIGIDGEKQFRDSLRAIDSDLNALNSRMDATVDAFEGMEDSEEAVTEKSKILASTIDAQERKISLLTSEYDRSRAKLDDLGKALENARREFGESSVEAGKAQNAYNRQVTAVNKLETQLNKAQKELNSTKREMRDLGNAAAESSKDIETAGTKIAGMGKALGGGLIVGGVTALAGSLRDLVSASAEYNKVIGSLEVSSESAGYSASETAEAYNMLYGMLGDRQQAVTALSNLQAMGLAQEDLLKMIDISAGAWAKYGDSIPIDGLSEAINETVRVGKITGNLADVFNWGEGASEDEFNERLAQTASEAERVQLIMSELSAQGLPALAQGWRDNNSALVELNIAQSELDGNLARLGELATPLVASFTGAMGKLVGVVAGFGEQIQEEGAGFMLEYIEGAVKKMPQVSGKVVEMVKSLLAELSKKGGELAGSLARGLVESIPKVLLAVPQIIKAITAFIGENLPYIADAGFNILIELGKGILSAIPDLVMVLPEVMSAIVLGLGNLLGGVVDVGRNVVKGLWQGIKSQMSWLVSMIKDWAADIIDTVMDVFDEHSPSRVFRDIGANLSKGLAMGIDDAAGIPLNSVQKMSYDIIASGSGATQQATQNQGLIEGLVNGLSFGAGAPIQLTAQLVLPNGQIIAETIFDDLRNVSAQRGVSLATY